jgi:integrase
VLNPFIDVVPKLEDSTKREPLFEKDMLCVKNNLHKLRDEDQLLWIWLATTGMRLSEPFEVDREFEEAGIRYIVVGHKTPSSRRRIPIPDPVAKRLPKPITAKVFSDKAETAAKRIRYFLKGLGISYDKAKDSGNKTQTLHSLRHRAADRLRAADCPDQIRYELLGHEEVTIAQSYGRGYPVAKLKDWIEKVGW